MSETIKSLPKPSYFEEQQCLKGKTNKPCRAIKMLMQRESSTKEESSLPWRRRLRKASNQIDEVCKGCQAVKELGRPPSFPCQTLRDKIQTRLETS